MRIYNGENLKHKNPDAKNVPEYHKEAHLSGHDEGFAGASTRFAFKILAETFNSDPEEVAADPLQLLLILTERVRQEHLNKEEEDRRLAIVSHLIQEFTKSFDKDVKKAYIENKTLGQNVFDRYILFADHWLSDEDYRDPISALSMTSEELEQFLEEVEAPAGVSNKKDFRNEVVKYCLRYRSQHNGANPDWTSYQKIREVIEAKIFSNLDDMLPIVSNTGQTSSEEKKQHSAFVKRMMEYGYTEKQVGKLVDWYVRSSKQ
jgi:serine protein kinase